MGPIFARVPQVAGKFSVVGEETDVAKEPMKPAPTKRPFRGIFQGRLSGELGSGID